MSEIVQCVCVRIFFSSDCSELSEGYMFEKVGTYNHESQQLSLLPLSKLACQFGQVVWFKENFITVSTYDQLVWFTKQHPCTRNGFASEKSKWETLLQLCTKCPPILTGKHKDLKQLLTRGTGLNHKHNRIIKSKSPLSKGWLKTEFPVKKSNSVIRHTFSWRCCSSKQNFYLEDLCPPLSILVKRPSKTSLPSSVLLHQHICWPAFIGNLMAAVKTPLWEYPFTTSHSPFIHTFWAKKKNSIFR